MKDTVTLDEFLAQYMRAPIDTKQAMLKAGFRVLDGADPGQPEPLRTLKKISAELGYHYTTLHKVHIQSVGESLGGRLKYKRSAVEAYLKSPEAAAIREELKIKRREREGCKHIALSG